MPVLSRPFIRSVRKVPDTVFLEESTRTEVRDATKAGRTTIAAGGDAKVTGMSGNPARSGVAYGKMGFELRNTANVAQIEEMIAARSH